MKNIEQPLWKGIAVPLTVFLISQAAPLIILVPILRGQSDQLMAKHP